MPLMYVLLSLLIFLASVVEFCRRKFFNYWKIRNVPVLNFKYNFINFFKLMTGKKLLGEFLRNVYETHSSEPYLGFYFLDQPCLLVNDINLLKLILVTDSEYFPERTNGLNEDNSVAANTLFVSKDPEWKILRKTISPLFSPTKWKTQLSGLSQLPEKLFSAMRTQLKKGTNILNVKNFTDKFMINAIVSSYFSIEGGSFIDDDSVFFSLTHRIMNSNVFLHAMQATYMILVPKLFGFFKLKYMDDYCSTFFRDITWKLLEERENRRDVVRKNDDLVDILLEIKKERNVTQFSSPDFDSLAGYVAQIYLAGYETSSTTISFTLLELAKNINCQKLARDEVIRVTKSYGELTHHSIENLKYLKNCFKEAARLYPILPYLDRSCRKDYKIPGTDLVIEEGVAVFIPMWGIHMDPYFHHNPTEFNPDRFTDENMHGKSDLTYFPFGAGPRSCPGNRAAEMVSVFILAHILMNFEIRLPEGCSGNLELSTMGWLLQPVKGFPLEFIDLRNSTYPFSYYS